MTRPHSLWIECPECKERTLHEVLKGKAGGKKSVLEATVRCRECGRTHPTVIREPEPVKVPVIVSDRGESTKREIELNDNEVLEVDNELFLDDMHIIITSLESGDARPDAAPVEDIDTIWAKRYDKIVVKVSINKGHKTVSTDLSAMPDEEFFVGGIIEDGNDKAVVHRVKTDRGVVREGAVKAKDIVRLYAKAMRSTHA